MKKKMIYVLCAIISLSLIGCKGKEAKSSDIYIYYKNSEGTRLEKEEYVLEKGGTEEKVKGMIKKLSVAPENIEYANALPENVSITKYEISNNELALHMNENYGSLSPVEEVLCRAALVQSFAQIEEINAVGIYIGEKPLLGKDEKPFGFMQADDFVESTGTTIHSYQKTELSLFFPNKKGDMLVSEEVNTHHNSNISIEKLVVEKLSRGPSTKELQPVIPQSAKLLGVSTKDRVCYINFDDGFVNDAYNLDPEVIIYAIVNSVIASSSDVREVQISINGETSINFLGSMKLDSPLSRNTEIVEEEKD